MEVTLLKGIKYKKKPYKVGESIEVNSKDIAEMIAKGVIAADVDVEDFEVHEVSGNDVPTRRGRKKDAEAEGDADPTPEG
ncbi:hypothetical protein [Paenibacillus xylanexedens]|uniref:DUF7210 domain-containing protein n=1 Tax=Paenibacillus xylanexedens TaxID=528191 RepID=A0ABS4RXY6_PAEXY|nr:hypothetical protein [Paenibacillus xylanexedens]MBP2247139.1 hypothetical protein [Paenibacillus xylanexedens]